MKRDFSLTLSEKAKLKSQGIKQKALLGYGVNDLCDIFGTSPFRAREILALTEFLSVPYVGIAFAQDLLSLGYFSLEELKNRNGSDLFNDLEQITQIRMDPCVEDQFRMVVYYTNHPKSKRTWWDFTAERKKFRAENGYPANRPG